MIALVVHAGAGGRARGRFLLPAGGVVTMATAAAWGFCGSSELECEGKGGHQICDLEKEKQA